MSHLKTIRTSLLVLWISAAVAVPALSAEEGPASAENPAENIEVAAAGAPTGGTGISGPVETLPPSFDPLNWFVYRPLWKLNGAIGAFNPIGDHVSAPLERAVPGLRVKGFINSITQVNTTHDNPNLGLAGRNKDWRLQKQEFRTQLELKYQATEHLEFININNYQFDGAYRWNGSDGLYTDGSSNQERYTQGKRIFREAYLRGNYGNINFSVGKQIVNWGKMDGKVIDIVNAADGRDVVDFHIGDYEWRAIGQWMGYLSLRPTETVTASLLWNPDFQPNVGPAYGSPWWFPFVPSLPRRVDSPKVQPDGFSRLEDSEVGGRVDTTLGALSLSGIAYYGFDRDGTYFADGTLRYLRTPKFGYALDYGTSVFGHRLVVRSEGLYTHGKPLNTIDPAATDGVVKKDSLKIAAALETSLFSDENKVDVIYQPIFTRQLGYDSRTKPFGVSRNDLLHVIAINHSVRQTNDKLALGSTFYVSGGSVYGGWAASYSAGWTFSDYLKATLAFNDYQGKNDDIPWGAYGKYKNVTADIKYEF